MNEEPGEPIAGDPANHQPRGANALEVGRCDETEEHEAAVVGCDCRERDQPWVDVSRGDQVVLGGVLPARGRGDANCDKCEQKDNEEDGRGAIRLTLYHKLAGVRGPASLPNQCHET